MTTRMYNVVKYLQKMVRVEMSGIVTSIYSEITLQNTEGAIKMDNPEQHRLHKTKTNKTKTQHNMC